MLQDMLLGLIQGLTEFLPVSSSGHLVLFSHWLQVADDDVFMEIILHAGTLLATLLVFRKQVWSILSGSAKREKTALREAGLIVTACVPTALIGILFKDFFESLFQNTLAVSGFLLFTGSMLYSSRFLKQKNSGDEISFLQALLVGTIQGMAIVPGISRSGSTIVAALALGVSRRRAGEFSFLISLPAVAGAVLLKSKELADTTGVVLDAGVAAGLVISFLSGWASLLFLMRFVQKGKLHNFAWYVWALGFVGVFWSLS